MRCAYSAVLRAVGFSSPILAAHTLVEFVHVCVGKAFCAFIGGMSGTHFAGDVAVSVVCGAAGLFGGVVSHAYALT